MEERKQMERPDISMNVISIGMSLFHEIYSRYLYDMIAEVERASRPDRVVASPYDGIRNGRTVMMKMPKPKPVVRCTKLAPTVSRNIAVRFSTMIGKDTIK